MKLFKMTINISLECFLENQQKFSMQKRNTVEYIINGSIKKTNQFLKRLFNGKKYRMHIFASLFDSSMTF